jgi:hypothetical protein
MKPKDPNVFVIMLLLLTLDASGFALVELDHWQLGIVFLVAFLTFMLAFIPTHNGVLEDEESNRSS